MGFDGLKAHSETVFIWYISEISRQLLVPTSLLFIRLFLKYFLDQLRQKLRGWLILYFLLPIWDVVAMVTDIDTHVSNTLLPRTPANNSSGCEK